MSGCTHSDSTGSDNTTTKAARGGERSGLVDADPGRDVRPKIRQSKVGKWRALSLFAVYVLIALHVAWWMTKGTTISPLEPSEGMQLGLQGVVNAGLVFFALTIVSTFVLGRWFCGWACHIVALQDGCRWILGKMRIHPRMVNLGLLGTVPWLAFAYMFLMPIVRRLMLGESFSGLTFQLYTEQFWKTFPSWPVALVTFAVCGFAIVYFLGAKGFCNYGCPYGAVFGIADQLAPVRIRVTDACEGCGHCTAVCSSNVKVHQEVRDFGMVVDPGCMKCLDCVSVCPKDALYVGFGAPAITAKLRTPPANVRKAQTPLSLNKSHASKPNAGFALEFARWLLLAAFMAGTYFVLLKYNGTVSAYVNPPEWGLIGAMTALSVAVVFVFRGKARRAAEYSLAEEALLGLAFLGAMFAFRGLRGAVPLLFAFGLSGLFAWASVQAGRLLWSQDARIQRIVLKREGHFRPAGFAFAAVMLLCFSGLAFAWHEQASLKPGGRSEMARLLVFEGQHREGVEDQSESVRIFERALLFDPDSTDAHRGLASSLCRLGRFDEGLAEFERALALDPQDADTHGRMAAALLADHQVARALPHVREAVRLAPERAELHLFLADVLDALGQPAEAAAERAVAQSLPANQPH